MALESRFTSDTTTTNHGTEPTLRTQDQYQDSDTRLHRHDPRVRTYPATAAANIAVCMPALPNTAFEYATLPCSYTDP